MPSRKIHMLVAPLDWGIGHATRCVPIIRMLLQKGAHVTLVGSGQSLAFLKLAFPELHAENHSGINVQYPERGSMALKMAFSAPGFLAEIVKEHRWLERYIQENRIDAVISDNRFGFWSKKVPSIYITHQLMIRLPKHMIALEPLMFRSHNHFIKKYTECWIPDWETGINLSGDLSHKFTPPDNAFFIGPLSRFQDYRPGGPTHDKKYPSDLLIMLSGPEPQRSILENILRREIARGPALKVVILQGKPKKAGIEMEQDGIRTFSHLPDHQIADLVRNAGLVVCRSGYSTIMDLVHLRSTALLVPTPGQTEQEYLGNYLASKGWFQVIRQAELSMDNILEARNSKNIQLPEFQVNDSLEKRIDHLLESIRTGCA